MHFYLVWIALAVERDKRGEFAWIKFFPSLPSVDHHNYSYMHSFQLESIFHGIQFKGVL